MKWIILIIAYFVIYFTVENSALDEYAGCLAWIIMTLLITILWLIVFYVFDVQLPKITI